LVDETNPINGRDLGAVAESLILETPTNPEPKAEETVEATEDTQTEAVEDAEVVEDAIEASDDSEEYSDDAEYEETEEPTVQEEPLYTVKINGEERQVNLEELTRGYSGQKYIQEGMAENAKVRKEVEALAQQATQERQMLRQMMQNLQQNGMPPMPEYPPEELRESDPLGYLEKEAEYRRAVDKRQQWERQIQAVNQRDAEQKAQQHNANMQHQIVRLAEWMPEFADPEKRASLVQDITTKAKKHYKLTDEQMSVVESAEEILILNDALKWRELQASKSKATKKAEGARPVVKPAAKRAVIAGKKSAQAKAKATMEKTGSVDDVAKFLLS
jgi:hypothetical protein